MGGAGGGIIIIDGCADTAEEEYMGFEGFPPPPHMVLMYCNLLRDTTVEMRRWEPGIFLPGFYF
jgi:hypothetical protein